MPLIVFPVYTASVGSSQEMVRVRLVCRLVKVSSFRCWFIFETVRSVLFVII